MPDPTLDLASFAALVDHTILKPEATAAQVAALCAEAVELTTASVCVNGMWVKLVASELTGTPVKTCSVVGFPLGAMSDSSLSAEIVAARSDGAHELDMVIPVGPLIDGDTERVASYLHAARRASEEAVLKVILETALLSDQQIVNACRLSVEAGADFVKTSTGFNAAGGASTAAVALMRDTVGPNIGVKASGGIRTLDDVAAMITAGANRLGMSSTVSVAAQLNAQP